MTQGSQAPKTTILFSELSSADLQAGGLHRGTTGLNSDGSKRDDADYFVSAEGDIVIPQDAKSLTKSTFAFAAENSGPKIKNRDFHDALKAGGEEGWQYDSSMGRSFTL